MFCFFPHPIYYLRPSFLSPSYHINSRNSDPGSHSRVFSLPTTVRIFYREKIPVHSSLVDSRRAVLTHARRSRQITFDHFCFRKYIPNLAVGGIRTPGPTLQTGSISRVTTRPPGRPMLLHFLKSSFLTVLTWAQLRKNRPGRHAHGPGSSSASCCCNGSVGSIETHVSVTWKCGSLRFIFTHTPEDKKTKKQKNDCLDFSGSVQNALDFADLRDSS